MKKLIVASIAIVIIVGLVVGYAVINANSLIAALKPKLESIASQGLYSDVKIGEIRTSFFPTTKLSIDSIVSTDRSNPDNRLKLDNFHLHLNLFDLLSKKLTITELSLKQPVISITKDSSGISIAGLGKRPTKTENHPNTVTQIENNDTGIPSQKAGSDALPFTAALERLSISDASLNFHDKLANRVYDLRSINFGSSIAFINNAVNLTDIKLSAKPLVASDFVLTGQALGFMAQDKGASGDLGISSEFKISDLDSFLKSVLASALPISITGKAQNNTSIKGSIANLKVTNSLDLQESEISKPGVYKKALGQPLRIDSDIKLTSALFDGIHNIKSPFGAIELKTIYNMNSQATELEASSTALFGGKLASKAKVDSKQTLAALIDLNALIIQDALKALDPSKPAVLEGTLSNFNLDITGQLGANLMPSLSGKSAFKVSNGKLVGLNLAGDVLKLVSSLPFLSSSLYSTLTPSEQTELNTNETLIENMSADFKIENNSLNTSNLSLVSTLFTLDGQGRIGFDAMLDLQTEIRFSAALSKLLSAKVKEIGYALDSEGRLSIPLKISGQAPKLNLSPDLSKLVSLAAKNALKGKAADILKDSLGKKSGVGSLLGF